MKKFLTVLLVVSVLFTFSFGSAFAATPVVGETETLTRSEEIAKAQKEMIEALEKVGKNAKAELADEYVQAFGNGYELTVDGDVYAATIDAIVADYAKVINEATKMVKGDATITANYADAIAAKEVVVFEYNGTEVKLTAAGAPADAEVLAKTVVALSAASAEVAYYDLYTLANIVEEAKAYVNGELAKIDMSIYTNDVINADAAYPQTWAERAAEIKAELAKVVADTEVDMTKSVKTAKTALDKMFNVLDKLAVKDSYKDIYNNVYVTSYKLSAEYGLKTADDLDAEGANKTATKATLKAQIQSEAAAAYAAALSTYNASAKDAAAKADFETRQDKIDAYVEVLTVLVEEGKVTAITEQPLGVGNKYLDLVAKYEAAEELAAVLKLQMEKDGTLLYDAAKVDETLADLKVVIYNTGADAVVADFAKALVKEDLFAWNKEVALAKAEKNLADALEAKDYYAPEAAKVEAAYAKVIAKIEAAATQKQLNECALTADLSKIDDETAVEAKLAKFANTAKFETAVENYIKLYNLQSGAKTWADEYINEDVATADVVEYLAEAGARTNADVAALMAQAEAFAQAVKNNGTLRNEKEAAEAAATAAIKALPTVITLADKAAVEAAYELADEAKMTGNTKLQAAIAAVKAAEDKAIDDMIKALPAKITVADEAAVDAILAAIEAYEATEMYEVLAGEGFEYDQAAKAEAADLAVRAAELAAVKAAIAAVNEAVPATVEAARAAVDAYVAEYTSAVDADRAIDDITNIARLTYAEAQVALAKVEAVEALKITASSKATKGAITVKWTVKGDTSAVEGYEIWKSTKKNSGYKKAFTATKMSYKNTKGLKKGTRYFYKVRAIAFVGEEKITSDWSNKAYRVAK